VSNTNVPSQIELSAGGKSRGIGILANEETNLIGWKPMPLILAHADSPKAKGHR
jgi:hypothetical protein